MSNAYTAAQERIRSYFNTTGFEKWQQFSRGEARNRIQRSIVAGREKTMSAILEWSGGVARKTVLDAGCGPGAFAFRLAERGAVVTGMDISEREIEAARARAFEERVENARFIVGDFYAIQESFEMVVCIDSLIYYREDDLVNLLRHLTERAKEAVFFTFTPSTMLLELMHVVGQVFPKGNTSPDIQQIKRSRLFARIDQETRMRVNRTYHVNSSFYQSTVVELRR
jgi:magnesium-protoporphyrin O-methyltransferase